MEQTQIIRKERPRLFLTEEVENVFKAHNLSLKETTKDFLAAGEWSDFLEDIKLDPETYKHGKIKLSREKDGTVKVNYQFHQEQLVVPHKIGKHQLSDDDRHKLANNEVVGPINYEGNEIYMRVDPQLNSVTVRTAKEISIPNVIGHNANENFKGYTLTDQDKNKLANGGALSTKLFCGKDGFFTANFAISEDKRGVIFTNVQSVAPSKVKELEARYNMPKSNLIDNVIEAGNKSVIQNEPLLENIAHSSNDVINNHSAASILNSEFKAPINEGSTLLVDDISKGQDKGIEDKKELNQDQKSIVYSNSEKEQADKVKETIQLNPIKEPIIEKIKEPIIEKKIKPGNPDLSQEFNDAVDRNDFKKLNELSERGWKPSEEEIKGLDKKTNLSINDKVAVKSIFNIENKPELSSSSKIGQTVGKELKFHKSPNEHKPKGQNKKAAHDAINRAFNDM